MVSFLRQLLPWIVLFHWWPTTAGSAHKIISTKNITEIVGGDVADIGEFPYYAVSASFLLCGGSLIHPDIVMTAEHCSRAFANGVRIGSTRFDGTTGGIRRLVRRQIHFGDIARDSLTSYQPEGRNYYDQDILLLLLDTPMPEGYPTLSWIQSSSSSDVTGGGKSHRHGVRENPRKRNFV